MEWMLSEPRPLVTPSTASPWVYSYPFSVYVRVTDSKTGQDITARVLAQILIELDTQKLGVFPVPLLHRLLQSNEQILRDFVSRYFNDALEAFLSSRRSFEQYLRNAMSMPGGTSNPPWAQAFSAFNPAAWGAPWAAE